MSKRLLVLGAGEAQLRLIKMSQALGYYTIVCDMRAEMEGSKIADSFYQVNYMDRNAILALAQKEKIDGVISNSEPAMVNVSWLVDKMGLPGNSVASVEKLLSKSKFRNLQSESGVFSPASYSVSDLSEAISVAKNMVYPIIIKPSQCSGSRGTRKITDFDKDLIESSFVECNEFSRNGLVTIEEFVEMKSSCTINADIFVNGEEILWDGWYANLRSKEHPLIPMTKILPPPVTETEKEKIMADVGKVIKASGVSLGEFNVETYFGKNGEVFIIEINPRQAGDDIPDLIKEHTGVDLTKLLVSLSVDDRCYYDYLETYQRENNLITLQVVFSNKNGIYQGLYIDEKLNEFVQWKEEAVEVGSSVKKAENAADAVAYVDFKFETLEQQIYYTERIEEFIYPIVN